MQADTVEAAMLSRALESAEKQFDDVEGLPFSQAPTLT